MNETEEYRQLRAAVVTLASDNVRLCNIAIAADKLVAAIPHGVSRKVDDALDEYRVVRNGS